MNRFVARQVAGLAGLAFAGLMGVTAACADSPAPQQNVVQLSASGQVEVVQDLLMLTLSTTRENADAAVVQAQLKTVLDGALAEARRAAQPGQMDVRTGSFNLSPRYGKDGRISGWAGTAELVLEGRDFARITGTAGRIQGLTVGGVSFGLSTEQRLRVEAGAQSEAIARFQAKAGQIAKDFGFAGYTLREVNVSGTDPVAPPRPKLYAMQVRAAEADAAVPVEAGKSTVVVTVSGSVQLR